MPTKKLPPRPQENFWITSLKSQLSIEATHRRAGFSPIPEVVIRRRFWQYLRFLAAVGYLRSSVPEDPSALSHTAELRNFDLSDDGYRFVQLYGDRWVGRMYKDKGLEGEQKFLDKWHAQFQSTQ